MVKSVFLKIQHREIYSPTFLSLIVYQWHCHKLVRIYIACYKNSIIQLAFFQQAIKKQK